MIKRGTVFETKFMRGTVEITKVMRGTTPLHAKVYVTFIENGGSTVSDKYVYYGQPYGELPTPTRSGYTFISWFTTEGGTFGTDVDANDIVNNADNHSLYAFWYYSPQTPTITFHSKTDSVIYFYITNNAPYTVNVYYEHSDNTPDASYVTLDANTQSSLLSVTGLSPSTSYTVYARANKEGALSEVTSITQTTNNVKTANPTIVDASTSTKRYYVTNNDGATATIYADYSNPPTTNRGDIASGANTITINTGLTVPVTVYAYAQASGKDPSDVVSLTL